MGDGLGREGGGGGSDRKDAGRGGTAGDLNWSWWVLIGNTWLFRFWSNWWFEFSGTSELVIKLADSESDGKVADAVVSSAYLNVHNIDVHVLEEDWPHLLWAIIIRFQINKTLTFPFRKRERKEGDGTATFKISVEAGHDLSMLQLAIMHFKSQLISCPPWKSGEPLS